MSDVTIAVLIVLGLMLAFALGFRSGVAYCVRELKPLEDAVKELRAMRRK
jgi:hypothetical protein